MIITPHMLVGASIGTQTSNLEVCFVLAWLSHYFLDFLPHWDYLDSLLIKNNNNFFKKLFFDFALGALLVFALTGMEFFKLSILAGMVGSLVPDFLQFLYQNYKNKWLGYFSWFHCKIHIWKGLSFSQGLPAALLISLISIFVLWG